MEIETGFETIGNATLVVHDRGPLLATDPWFTGPAYMGSWTLSHEIPAPQLEAIQKCPYLWISHGHPDHLSSQSLNLLTGKKIFLPDHVGGRIYEGLKAKGHDLVILKDRQWHILSDRVRILSIADPNQDAVLLVDINGRLIVNFNDSSDLGVESFVRRVIKKYKTSFILRLAGYGDAAMINFFNESGKRITAPADFKTPLPGAAISRMAESFGASYFVPFSSMHRYQREDSAWANECTISLAEYSKGFESRTCRILPAFIRWDCLQDKMETINPPEHSGGIKSPETFGDSWADVLEKSEVQMIEKYFKSIAHLETFLGFINFRCGKKDRRIVINKRFLNRGVTFEVPRNSLMTAVRYEIFDDLLIGNFMKTTLHGNWGKSGLYPDFTPYVARYADNGGARTPDELKNYFKQYRGRAPLDYFYGGAEKNFLNLFRSLIPYDSGVYQYCRQLYHRVKRGV